MEKNNFYRTMLKTLLLVSLFCFLGLMVNLVGKTFVSC